MDAITESLTRAVDELLGRASGPMHFRLVMQPIVAIVLAIRAGIRDAREGRSPYLWTLRQVPSERRRLIASGLKDIGKVLTLAIVLDVAYQVIVLHQVRVLQTLIVAVVVAVLPYVLFRGPTTRLARGRSNR
jgi:hypothetical protein